MTGEFFQHFNTFFSQLFVSNVLFGQIKGTSTTHPTEQHSRIGGLNDIEAGKIMIPRLFVS
jgi:hypothetical protein